MVHKKVGTITLEYDRGDGTTISEAFQGEFVNAIFNGVLDVRNSTFDGSFTADAINVIDNIHIRGQAVATTTMTYIPTIGKGGGPDGKLGEDDGQFHDVVSHTFYVDPNDFNGGWAYINVQWLISNTRHSQDKEAWHVKHQVLINGELNYFTPYYSPYAMYFRAIQNFKYTNVIPINSPGYYTVQLQFAFQSENTNVYPYWDEIFVRVDYLKK